MPFENHDFGFSPKDRGVERRAQRDAERVVKDGIKSRFGASSGSGAEEVSDAQVVRRLEKDLEKSDRPKKELRAERREERMALKERLKGGDDETEQSGSAVAELVNGKSIGEKGQRQTVLEGGGSAMTRTGDVMRPEIDTEYTRVSTGIALKSAVSEMLIENDSPGVRSMTPEEAVLSRRTAELVRNDAEVADINFAVDQMRATRARIGEIEISEDTDEEGDDDIAEATSGSGI